MSQNKTIQIGWTTNLSKF